MGKSEKNAKKFGCFIPYPYLCIVLGNEPRKAHKFSNKNKKTAWSKLANPRININLLPQKRY